MGREFWEAVGSQRGISASPLMEAQEASKLASYAELEQGLCKRDADDPVCKRFVFPEPFDRLLRSVRSPVK
jgi:hypothetical protein